MSCRPRPPLTDEPPELDPRLDRRARRSARPARWRLYAELTKARLSALVLVTTAVGHVLAAQASGGLDLVRLACTIVGTGFAAGCANALNQVLEAPRDAVMLRTRHRPVPAGTLSRRHAIGLALGLGVVGLAVLLVGANAPAAALALLCILIYVLIYTPLKTRSTLNTLVGAVCGAMPPMIGWVAATGRLGGGAWALAGLLFVWQLPHFLSLAWLYREDYARGGFMMLPVRDGSGRLTGQVAILTSLMLVPLALAVTLLGLGGWVFTAAAVGLALGMGGLALRLARSRANADARRLFLASLVHMSAVMLLLLVDRGPVTGLATIHGVATGTAEPPAAAWTDADPS